MRRSSPLSSALAVSLIFTCACYTTRSVSAPEVASPLQQQTPQEALLLSVEGKPLRVDPNSRIRFLRVDGSYSDWFRVSELAVSEEGVVLRSGGANGLLWENISSAEIKNFSGGRTLGAVAIAAAAVVVIVAAIAATDGKANIKPPKGVSPPPRAPRPGPSFNGCCVSSINVSPGPIIIQPGPTPTYEDPRSLGFPGVPGPDPEQTQNVFPVAVQRRAVLAMVGALDFTSDLNDTRGAAVGFDLPSGGASLVARLYDTVEIGGGVRQYFNASSGEVNALSAPTPSTIGFFRLGLNLSLNPRHTVSVPLSVDVGGSESVFYLKANAGLRFRLTDTLSLGAFFFNPTLINDETVLFPSSLEMSVSF